MQQRDNLGNLTIALDQLFALRDKWELYTSALSEADKKNAASMGGDIDYAAKLWLVDIYYKTHDHYNKALITARKIPKKYPQEIETQDVSKEVLSRLEKLIELISSLKSENAAWLHLQQKDLKQSMVTAHEYFSDGESFIASLADAEKEQFLTTLKWRIAEEELPS